MKSIKEIIAETEIVNEAYKKLDMSLDNGNAIQALRLFPKRYYYRS
jgi:hypothetical protein